MRLAAVYVSSRAAAEEITHATWKAVLRGIDRGDATTPLRTWVCSILINCANARAGHAADGNPPVAPEADGAPAVDPQRFWPSDDPNAPGAWASPPREWEEHPERQSLACKARGPVDQAVAGLPSAQRAVITLHDVSGLTSLEVAKLLGLTPASERRLLHRARSGVRASLEPYFDAVPVGA